MLQNRPGRRQFEAHPRAIDLDRNIGPPGLDHEVLITVQKLDGNTSGTPGAIGAESRLTPVRVAIAEPYSAAGFGLEGKRPVSADPALPVAQPAHEIRLLIETSGPCSNAEQEIVSCSFNLEKLRPHGTAPMTTTQLA
jgi:hypothetical protein